MDSTSEPPIGRGHSMTPAEERLVPVTSLLTEISLTVCPHPVFVIGSPRSGTSILAWSLAQHGHFWTSSETDFLLHLFGQGRLESSLTAASQRPGGGWLSEQRVERDELFPLLGVGINALITSRSGGKRWVDQSPSYTLMASTLAELFPGAFFLHILRDGRRVVNSMVNSGFTLPWATDFGEAARTWAIFAERALNFAASMPSRCLTIRQEELAANPIEQFESILKFLGAPEQPTPAEFFAANRINSSYHPQSQRQGGALPPVSTPPNAYQGPTEPWDAWTPEQRAVFTAEAGEMFERCRLLESK